MSTWGEWVVRQMSTWGGWVVNQMSTQTFCQFISNEIFIKLIRKENTFHIAFQKFQRFFSHMYLKCSELYTGGNPLNSSLSF